VLTANYSAEYGRASSGVVRLVTKSGTRRVSRKLIENIQNSRLDANTWSRNASGNPRLRTVPPRKVNQFGASLGGPIFILEDSTPIRRNCFSLLPKSGLSTSGKHDHGHRTVLRDAKRRLHELLNPANPFFNRARVITDPQNGQAFANNVIPSSRFSANGLALLRVYPEPTPGFLEGASNYIGTRHVVEQYSQRHVSLDYVNHRQAHAGLPRDKHQEQLQSTLHRHSYDGTSRRKPQRSA
jgi:hypothetical protein